MVYSHTMDYEIAFLAVGNKRSGDAIALRFGNLSGYRDEQTVVVIDGGDEDSGENLVQLLRHDFRVEKVDFVFSTHPHEDHVSGLRAVVREMEVGALLMHQPWLYSRDCEVLDSCRMALELCAQARNKDVKVVEPVVNLLPMRRAGGLIQILGPSRPYYRSLLSSFPKPGPYSKSEPRRWHEEWDVDTLDNDAVTTATNNSSVILQVIINVGGSRRRFLFTGDAGIPALWRAIKTTRANLVKSLPLEMVQVPHHGSKHNVGPGILDRIVGRKIHSRQFKEWRTTAIVSCAEEDKKHPNKRVINAFMRRGARCYATKGDDLCFSSAAPHALPEEKLERFCFTVVE